MSEQVEWSFLGAQIGFASVAVGVVWCLLWDWARRAAEDSERRTLEWAAQRREAIRWTEPIFAFEATPFLPIRPTARPMFCGAEDWRAMKPTLTDAELDSAMLALIEVAPPVQARETQVLPAWKRPDFRGFRARA